MNLQYSVNDNTILKVSISRRLQNLNKLYFETVFGQNIQYFYLSENDTYPLQKSNNCSIGSTYNKRNFYADIELYYTSLDGNLLYTTLIGRPTKDKPFQNNEFLLFQGNAKNYGLDLLLRFKHSHFTHSLAYSFNDHKQNFDGIYQNMPIPSPDNRPHVLNISNDFRIKNISINHNFLFMSGNQFLSFRNNKGLDKNQAPRNLFAEKIPDYLSFDLGINYNFSFKKRKISLGLVATNITNNKNIKYIQQTGVFEGKKGDKPILSGNEALMLGRFFNVSFGFEF
jgi:hypothetical protein